MVFYCLLIAWILHRILSFCFESYLRFQCCLVTLWSSLPDMFPPNFFIHFLFLKTDGPVWMTWTALIPNGFQFFPVNGKSQQDKVGRKESELQIFISPDLSQWGHLSLAMSLNRGLWSSQGPLETACCTDSLLWVVATSSFSQTFRLRNKTSLKVHLQSHLFK